MPRQKFGLTQTERLPELLIYATQANKVQKRQPFKSANYLCKILPPKCVIFVAI
jgi:hypothetical protein